MSNIKLSIITPYYNTLKYTFELAKVLIPQLNSSVEWIIVDDGCHEEMLDRLTLDQVFVNANYEFQKSFIKVIHLDYPSGNASKPRNVGIDNALGKYITFVDSDDMVTDNYVSTILNKIKEDNFDYCFYSWKTMENDYIITDEPLKWNHNVWNCVYSKLLIGKNRFDENRNINEDLDFNNRVRKGKKANILDILYIFNNEREGSLTSLYNAGRISFIKKN